MKGLQKGCQYMICEFMIFDPARSPQTRRVLLRLVGLRTFCRAGSGPVSPPRSRDRDLSPHDERWPPTYLALALGRPFGFWRTWTPGVENTGSVVRGRFPGGRFPGVGASSDRSYAAPDAFADEATADPRKVAAGEKGRSTARRAGRFRDKWGPRCLCSPCRRCFQGRGRGGSERCSGVGARPSSSGVGHDARIPGEALSPGRSAPVDTSGVPVLGSLKKTRLQDKQCRPDGACRPRDAVCRSGSNRFWSDELGVAPHVIA